MGEDKDRELRRATQQIAQRTFAHSKQHLQGLLEKQSLSRLQKLDQDVNGARTSDDATLAILPAASIAKELKMGREEIRHMAAGQLGNALD
jgi:hypothetical protein